LLWQCTTSTRPIITLGANLEHSQAAFEPLLYGVGVAIVLTFFLKETGPAHRLAA
jgi:hypothetical protein